MDIVSHGDSASAETATSKAAARLESLDRQQLTQGPNSCLAAKISDSDVDCADLPVPETETNSLIQHDSEQSQGHKPADAGFVSPADPAGKPARPRGYKHGKKGTPKSQLVCKVDNCNTPLSSSKAYYQRHRVCAIHLAAMIATVDGVDCRFCQQCGKFQPIEEFDTDKRSCRTRLKRHNNRRREQRHGRNLDMRKLASEPAASQPCQQMAKPSLQGPCKAEPPEKDELQGALGCGRASTASGADAACNNNSPRAVVKYEASPNASTGTHAGGNGTPANALRDVVRRTSATKALEALKNMNASSSSTASDFEDTGAEEAHQKSPVAAAPVVAPSCRPRRRLDMSVAVVNSSHSHGRQLDATDKASSQLQGLLQYPAEGVWQQLGSVQLASVMQAASAVGVQNKCAASIALPALASDTLLGSRSHVGPSRFAKVQQSQALAEQLDLYHKQQQQLGAWQLDGLGIQQHSQGLATDVAYDSQFQARLHSMHLPQMPVLSVLGVGQTFMEQPGSLAQHHSAPPLMHTTSNMSDHDNFTTASKAGITAVSAGRCSDVGCLTATLTESSFRQSHHQQQPGLHALQEPPVMGTVPTGGHGDASAGTLAQQQQSLGTKRSSYAGNDSSMHTQQHNCSLQAAAPAEGRRVPPTSVQVLESLKRQGVFSPPTPKHPVGLTSQKRQSLDATPSVQQPGYQVTSNHAPVAMSAGPHVPARMSDSGLPRRIVSPFQIAIAQQPRHLLSRLRPCVSYSGGCMDKGMLDSPCVSLTAPLRQNLTGINLQGSAEQSGYQSTVQDSCRGVTWGQLQQLRASQQPARPSNQQEAPQHSELQQQNTAGDSLPPEVAAPQGDSWMEVMHSPVAARQHSAGPIQQPEALRAAEATWQQQEQCLERGLSHTAFKSQQHPCTLHASAVQQPLTLQDRTCQQYSTTQGDTVQDGFSTQSYWQGQYSVTERAEAWSVHRDQHDSLMVDPQLMLPPATGMTASAMQLPANHAALATHQHHGMRASTASMHEDAAAQAAAAAQQPCNWNSASPSVHPADCGYQHSFYVPGSTGQHHTYPQFSAPDGQQHHTHDSAELQGPCQADFPASQQYPCTQNTVDVEQHVTLQDHACDQQHTFVQHSTASQQHLTMQDAASQQYPSLQGSNTEPDNEAVADTPAAGSEDNPFLQCMSTDEDFGDLLELLLEGEETQQ